METQRHHEMKSLEDKSTGTVLTQYSLHSAYCYDVVSLGIEGFGISSMEDDKKYQNAY